ncbi:MAG: anthranilate phosphoribosyltransferase [Hyphomonadaceae bacterium]|nr:anthranilate phosphoribosyltransferase [Clostridia bacterium]
MKQAIHQVVGREHLTYAQAKEVMHHLLGGDATEAQTASFFTALRMKGETIDEIAGLAAVLREKATSFTPDVPFHVDTCGTGGDGVNTFNISTAATFVAAAAGVKIAKHGNRAISSKSGSADVLEALGIDIALEAHDVKKSVEEFGLGFMFARVFHKHMALVSKVRGDLSMRTVFNILGPLSNPSNAKGQFMGVFDGALTTCIANVMMKLGVTHGLVVHGKDGLDEITTTTETIVAEIKNGEIIEYMLTPEQFGLERATIDQLRGGDATENAQIIVDIFKGEKGAKRDIVGLNAGAIIYIGKQAKSLSEGVKIAQQVIDNGLALEKLQQFTQYTEKLKEVSV